MKKVVQIHIGSAAFFFDDDAAQILEQYIERIKQLYKDNGEELKVAEVEQRIAEMCRAKAGEGGIVTNAIITEAIEEIGIKIEQEPQQEKAAEKEQPAPTTDESPWQKAMLKGCKLFRDTRGGYIGGVLAGFAAYYGVSAGLLRLITILLFLLPLEITGLPLLLAYIVLWMVLPKAVTIIDYTRMRRVKANSTAAAEQAWQENYERTIKELSIAADDGCLRTIVRVLFFILMAFAALPLGLLLIIAVLVPIIFVAILFNASSIITIGHVLLFVGIIITIGFPLFAILHWILKKTGKCKPMKLWVKTTLVVAWLATGIATLAGCYFNKENYHRLTSLTHHIINGDIDELLSIGGRYSTTIGNFYQNHPLTSNGSRKFGAIWEKDLHNNGIPLTIESIHGDNGVHNIYFYQPTAGDNETANDIHNKKYIASYTIDTGKGQRLNGYLHFLWDGKNKTLYIDNNHPDGAFHNINGEINEHITLDNPAALRLRYADERTADNSTTLIPFEIFYYGTQCTPVLIVNKLQVAYYSSCTIIENETSNNKKDKLKRHIHVDGDKFNSSVESFETFMQKVENMFDEAEDILDAADKAIETRYYTNSTGQSTTAETAN